MSAKVSTRLANGARYLIEWYRSPSGIVLGICLSTGVLLAWFGTGAASITVIAIGIGLVCPWGFVRQRQAIGLRDAQQAERDQNIDRHLATLAPRDWMENHVTSLKKQRREQLARIRNRVGRTEQQLTKTHNRVGRTEQQLDLTSKALTTDVASLHGQARATERRDEATREWVQKLSDNFYELRRDTTAEIGRNQAHIRNVETQTVDKLVVQLRELETTLSEIVRSQNDLTSEVSYRRGHGQQIVFGLGTGRSGTVSLARLLDSQPSASITHEVRPLLPWEFDQATIDLRLEKLRKRPTRTAGDVGYYYLPYVTYIAEKIPTARFVCIRRNRADVIASQMKKTERYNLWLDHDGTDWELNEVWDKTMPSYPPMPKEEAIGRYWDEYNERTIRLSQELGDRFEIFDLESTMNDPQQVRRLLNHVGISDEDQRVFTGIHENAIATSHGEPEDPQD